jgi:hypothetical protein
MVVCDAATKRRVLTTGSLQVHWLVPLSGKMPSALSKSSCFITGDRQERSPWR